MPGSVMTVGTLVMGVQLICSAPATAAPRRNVRAIGRATADDRKRIRGYLLEQDHHPVSWAGFYARVGAHPDGSPPRCSPGRMAALTFNCAQCGGVLDPPVGARFAVCPFCGSSVFFDRSRAVLHFVAERTLDEPAARAR